METLMPYSLCVKVDSGALVGVVSGHANAKGLYQLVIKLSDMRQLMPQLYLVVNDHLVNVVEVRPQGMTLKGQPISGVDNAD